MRPLELHALSLERAMTGDALALNKNPRRNERAEPPLQRPSKGREQGQWSFLTWSFFLSQILAAEQAVAMAAQPGATTEEAATHADPASAAGPNSGMLLSPEAMALAIAGEAGGGTPGQALDIPHVGFGDFAAVKGAPEGEADWAVRLSGREATGASQGIDAFAAVDGDSGAELGHPLTAEPPLLDPIVGPVVNIVGDVIHVLDPVVDGVVAPMLDLVGDILGGVVQVADPLLDITADLLGGVVQAADPLLDVTTNLLGGVVQAADPLLDVTTNLLGGVVHAADPLLDIPTDLLGDVVQAADPLVDNVVGPVLGTLGGPLDALLGLVSNDGAAEYAVVAGSGSLDFEAAPPLAGTLLNEVFKAGSYTEFGLSLHGETPTGTGSAPAMGDDIADQAQDILAAIAGHAPPAESQPSASHNHSSLPHLVSDIGLHGLGL
jgi:hypothetical protein